MKKVWIILFVALMLLTSQVRADDFPDERLLQCIIQCESGGDPNAISKAGAIGLCQVTQVVFKEWQNEANNPPYNHDWKFTDLYNPEYNVRIGTWYLRRLKEHYLGDVIERIKYIDNENRLVMWKYNVVGEASAGGELWAYNENEIYRIPLKKLNITTPEDYKLALILLAWNGGITRLREVNYDINKMPRESREFTKRVLKLYKENL